MPDSASACYGWNAYASGPLAAGPLLGEVSAASARIWVQARDTAPISLRITSADGRPERTLEASPTLEEWLCVIFEVTDLRPDVAYEYALFSEHGESARYQLRLGPVAGSTRLRIAFGSCYKEYSRSDLRIFDSIGQSTPDLFLMLGDTCYTDEDDRRSEATHMGAHLRNRNNDALRRLIASVPTLGIWDDHDFGPNDSDGRYPEKARALRCFRRMWTQREYGTESTPGIFSKIAWGPVDLFLLDSRYHRRERQCILGEAQLRWLLDGLRQSRAPVKLLLSGSQLLPEVAALASWNWECFRRDGAQELLQLQRFLSEEGIEGVVALSGDPHLGQLLHAPGAIRGDGQRGPDLWELTSSPLANRPWEKPVWPADSHGEHAFDGYLIEEIAAPNFGMLDVDLSRAGSELRLSLRGEDGAELFAYELALATLTTRPPRSPLCAAVRDGKHAYEFRAGQYSRYDLAAGSAESGYPRSMDAGWKGVFPDQVKAGAAPDAVLFSKNGKAYFFLGNGYVRYDLEKDRIESGYPKYIKRHWKGVWAGNLDAILMAGPDQVYFIKGPDCIRYDLHADQADPGYPRPLAEEFPGVWADGIDGAVAWPDGGYYFLRGDEVLRFDPASGAVSPGYPRTRSQALFGFLS